MKKYIVSFVLLLMVCVQVNAQDQSQVKLSSPLDIPLVLSGNFGEIRANHFHGGLDFKTQGASGKKIYAMDNGYIARIRVTHGSGYVLDVQYDNGYTTTLRHDEGYVGEIARRIEDLQYEKESWEVEITPEPGEYPVKAGQLIGFSGNLGYSFGPHLHLEMYETATGDFIDPLPFFKSKIRDTRAPQVMGFMLFPQTGQGIVNGESEAQTFKPEDKSAIEAWGVIGAGIRAYDYMDGANNRYGVHTVQLIVDGEEVFKSVVDRFSTYENRMINSWTHGQYMKSFIEPGNTLRLLKAHNDNRGLITINEERDYHFLYILKDLYGNTTRFNFAVKGKKADIPQAPEKGKYYFAWNKFNYLYEPGLALIVPQKMLYDDVYLDYSVKIDSAAVAYTHQLTEKRVPLHSYCDLKIGIRNKPVADMTKYYVARVTDKGKLVSVGGKYEDGYMKARIRELATYTVAVDTVAPKVIAVGKNNWVKNGKVTYRIEEEGSGVNTYRGTIDGKYALFGLHIMRNRLICELDSRRVKKGGTHDIEITVTDKCGNETVIHDTFVW